MHISEEVAAIINAVFISAKNARFEYVTPEQVLYEICRNRLFAQAFENCGGNVKELSRSLQIFLKEYMESVPAGAESMPEFSQGMGAVLAYAWESAQGSGKYTVELPHILHAMYRLEEIYAV